jgi:RhtB (resistance to homoserine/threonine) family protein
VTHWFLLWAAWASINLAATISPGPAFAMTVRTALAHNRRAGVVQSIGLGLGVAVHVALISCGLAALMRTSAVAFEALKYAGAAYLVYLGGKALRAKKKTPEAAGQDIASAPQPASDGQSLRVGFLTNLLNPKSMVFFSAMFTQFLSGQTPWRVILALGATSTIIEACWFSVVTCVLTTPKIKNHFLSVSHWIERVCGALLVGLGLKLALSKVTA